MRTKRLLFFAFLILFSCSQEGKRKLPKGEIYKIQEVGKLSTTEYIFSKVLKINDKGEWYKFGDRKILLSCKAKVKAGIDLSQIDKKEIIVEKNKLTLFLPRAIITSFDMDPTSIRTEMINVNGMRDSFSQEEKNEILQKGEASIRKSLAETGIYKEAEKNAVSFVKEFYRQMGFETVVVKFHGGDER